ncbi:MAG: hypothetical protein HRT58_01325 [Crocinitomicaceae bacterium]|nr:hypothetical protein [Flavobacteriales bacterium]NQZ34264.1 hypothetical protein [Crocinitomicaceae bacterium]
MKLFSILAVSILLFACNNTKEVLDIDPIEVKKAQIGDVMQESAPITVTAATLDGNILSLEIEYSGGCKDHTYELIGSEAIMKSLPAKRAIKLVHNSNDDTCRELISETIKFNIRAFSVTETKGSEIVLLLDGYKQSISYVYP